MQAVMTQMATTLAACQANMTIATMTTTKWDINGNDGNDLMTLMTQRIRDDPDGNIVGNLPGNYNDHYNDGNLG
jgi:hypothetical protein